MTAVPAHLQPIAALRDGSVQVDVVTEAYSVLSPPGTNPGVLVFVGADGARQLLPSFWGQWLVDHVAKADRLFVTSIVPAQSPAYRLAAVCARLGLHVVLLEVGPDVQDEWVHFVQQHRTQGRPVMACVAKQKLDS